MSPETQFITGAPFLCEVVGNRALIIKELAQASIIRSRMKVDIASYALTTPERFHNLTGEIGGLDGAAWNHCLDNSKSLACGISNYNEERNV